MKQRIFEDSEIPDVNRQITGMGTEYANSGGERLGNLLQRKNDLPNAHDETGVPYPLDNIDAIIADIFININNVQQAVEIAKNNPTLKSKRKQRLLRAMEGDLRNIAKTMLDFDDHLAIIKGNE